MFSNISIGVGGDIWTGGDYSVRLNATLLVLTWRDRSSQRAYLIAMLCYAALFADFFIFNWPVNEALRGWTPVTLPSNWSDYPLRWEIGHALAALLSVIAFVTLIRRRIYEGSQS